MSCYEWSSGTIKLPSAEYTRVKQTIALVMHKREERIFEETQKFWKSLSAKAKRDPEEYGKYLMKATFPDDIAEDVHWRLQLPYHRQPDFKPKRLLRSDFDWPTNRTTTYHESDLVIGFNNATKEVSYHVSENNHAREHAGNTLLSRTFEDLLAGVKWTAQSGGVIVGNDEYNRDNENVGGGGNYVVAAYGPLGAKEAPHNVISFLNSEGNRVMPEYKMKRNGTYDVKFVPWRAPARPSYGMSYGRF